MSADLATRLSELGAVLADRVPIVLDAANSDAQVAPTHGQKDAL